MKGLERITAFITSDAEKRGKEWLEATEQACRQTWIMEEGTCLQFKERKMAELELEIIQYKEHRLKQVQAEEDKHFLALQAARQRDAFAQAQQEITEWPLERALRFWTYQILRHAPEQHAEVILNKRDNATWGPLFIQKANLALESTGSTCRLTLSDCIHASAGGFYLCTGERDINCTLELLLHLLKHPLRGTMDTILEEGMGSERNLSLPSPMPLSVTPCSGHLSKAEQLNLTEAPSGC